ncbi:MAG TPA: glycosyl hydrolase family 65 protein [Longimicrobiales bacterium]
MTAGEGPLLEPPPTTPSLVPPGSLPLSPTPEAGWLAVDEGFDLAREHEIESIFTVANGFVGIRGSLAEGSALSAPAAFIAGFYDRGSNPESVPELVAAPDWMRLRIEVDGQPLRLDHGTPLEHRRILDFRQGILWREWRHCDIHHRITAFRELRLASLADRHVLLQSVELTPDNYSGPIRIECWIEPPATSPVPSDTGSPELLTLPPPPEPPPPGWARSLLLVKTRNTGLLAAFAAASRLQMVDGEPIEPILETTDEGPSHAWQFHANIDTTYRLDRLIVVHTSRHSDRPADAARLHLDRLLSTGIEPILADHLAAWQARWHAADVEIEGDEEAQRALRFACYHLIAAVNPEDERVSIAARTLSGPAYKGHVFWDAEIYVLPFFLFTHPESARSLLMYRYHTLPAAREKARTHGLRGAWFAWESADTGEETTPRFAIAPDGTVTPIRNGEQEIHISADIAYAVWQYWQATGDDAFFREAGAEILLETARFWASRVEAGEDGLYHIRHVIGPDEYHEDVDDDAYTNTMAQWNLERGAETARLLAERWPDRRQELLDTTGLDPDEPEQWLDIAARIYTGFDPKTGLFEQFRGYFDLEEIDLAEYTPRPAPMDVLLGRERIRRTKVIKQPDVVLLLYLFWDRFPAHVREANFRYYEPRCGHGSSLSPSIHALVAARLGDLDLAMRYFRQVAEIDLADNMGNAAGGVHAAALGGLWQAVIFGFAGLDFASGRPTVHPHLPPHWRAIRFPILWQGRMMRFNVGEEPWKETKT